VRPDKPCPRRTGKPTPVIVAALVNGNDTVGVVDAVNGHATREAGATVAADVVDGVEHVHDFVPVHERGHDHGDGHDHEDGQDHGHDQGTG
jgi:hypothetical protein